MADTPCHTLRLAWELSQEDVKRGLAAANLARGRANRSATRWVGLPEDLRRKMFNRGAMGFDVDENPNSGEIRANAVAVVAVLSTVLLGSAAALETLFYPSSLTLTFLAVPIVLAVLAAIRSRRAADLRAASHPLALTPMQRSVVRGYLISPPDLLPRRPDLPETRLTALAGLALLKASARTPDCVAVPAEGDIAANLDALVVDIYEQAFLISEAREALNKSLACRDSGSADDLRTSAGKAFTVLVDQVRDVCETADWLQRRNDEFHDFAGGWCCAQEPGSLTRDLLTGIARSELAELAIPTRWRA